MGPEAQDKRDDGGWKTRPDSETALRDQFAMHAPFAPFQTYAVDEWKRNKELREAATLRYEWADAMLEARK